MINQNFIKTLNVLYVEDSQTIRTQFTYILEKLFKKVIVAENGEEALAKFIANKDEKFKINVVVSDINMPKMSGMELLEKIREICNDIPFLITTAHAETDFLLQAIKFKATDYLIKPVDIKQLIKMVQNVCQVKYHENIKRETLKDVEQLTKTINEVALVLKTDLRGKITFANNLFYKTSGYKKSELVGQIYKILNHPDLEETVINNLWLEIQKGNMWEGKLKNISKTGETYHLYANIVPLLDKYDTDIIEFMWICFLTTEEEEEQNRFKKKVVKNVKETRRVNLEARQKIDELQTKLTKYKHFDMIEYALETEKKRTSKFKSQIKYYEKEVKAGEDKLNTMAVEVKSRLTKANQLSKEQKLKRDDAVAKFALIAKELKARQEDVKVLNEEIDKQINLIDELKEAIRIKEEQLGLTGL